MKLKNIITNIEVLNKKDYKENQIKSLFDLSNLFTFLQKVKLKSYNTLNTKLLGKRTPFFLLRKNLKQYFTLFSADRIITPNILKFLHILFFPKNSDIFWKHYYPMNTLDLKRLKYKKQNFRSFDNFYYYTSLIFKNNYIKKNYYLNHKSESIFIKNLKYLYFLSCFNTKNMLPLNIPPFMSVDYEKKNFKNFFILSFKEKGYLQKVVNFYYPTFSILIKEQAIHSLPLKTKKPRRV
jgi:hypothetical protein